MNLAKQIPLWSAIVLATMLFTGCGYQEASLTRDTNPLNYSKITVALGTETNGKVAIFAASPTDYASMAYCLVDSKFVCVGDETSLTFERAVGDRRIFRLREPAILTLGVWKFTAVHSNGGKIEQNVRLTAVSTNPGTSVPPTGGLNWKVLLMASDQGNTGAWIKAFDNARKALKQIFAAKGVPSSNFRELSLHNDQQSDTVKPTSAENFVHAMKSFGAPSVNDACLVHMTSHGSRDGFNLGSKRLAPSKIDEALLAGCAERPTVVLISACYSGLYVLDSSNLKKPNRIILTASRSDVTSFGCSSENEFTYWDGCLVESLPKATKWRDLASSIVACIVRKEGGRTVSFPQTFIGSDVADLDMPK
jgi:hypothetical protein